MKKTIGCVPFAVTEIKVKKSSQVTWKLLLKFMLKENFRYQDVLSLSAEWSEEDKKGY